MRNMQKISIHIIIFIEYVSMRLFNCKFLENSGPHNSWEYGFPPVGTCRSLKIYSISEECLIHFTRIFSLYYVQKCILLFNPLHLQNLILQEPNMYHKNMVSLNYGFTHSTPNLNCLKMNLQSVPAYGAPKMICMKMRSYKHHKNMFSSPVCICILCFKWDVSENVAPYITVVEMQIPKPDKNMVSLLCMYIGGSPLQFFTIQL